MMDINYPGTRWFKCDLHLHTKASQCFQDQSVTAEQWISRALVQGLNCVAVTDHNTGLSIDEIQTAAQGTSLTVFPGVEITCDTSKVHLLILFDIDKTTNHVNDFLIKCDIKREDFGKQETFTTKSINEIARIADEDGAIIIPAHIDEFNGLGSASVAVLKDFFALKYINAVQIVHKEMLTPGLNINGNNDLKTMLNEYYDSPSPAIDDSIVKEWYTPVKYATEANLAIVTFSDNPHEPKNSRHGLEGIGSVYTWIKMDANPTLEGLRQAFLLPQFRIKNVFEGLSAPFVTPELWMKSISITGVSITDRNESLIIEFSPQLNAIIGGRGSGKSSVLKFIRGLFNRTADIGSLNDILNEHNAFYKRNDERTNLGVLKPESVIVVEFLRNNVLHKITGSEIMNSTVQNIIIEKQDLSTKIWTVEAADQYLDFFQFEQYSQKQIYEIAQKPNSLRERIDLSIPGMEALKNSREIVKKAFLEKSAAIRTIRQEISGKGKLQTEVGDIEDRILKFQQSGISDLLTSKEAFVKEELGIKRFIEEMMSKELEIDALIASISVTDINYENFQDVHSSEMTIISKTVIDQYIKIKKALEKLKEEAQQARSSFNLEISKTQWHKDMEFNQAAFNEKKGELEKEGIQEMSIFETLSVARTVKQGEIAAVEKIEESLVSLLEERQRLKEENVAKTKEITSLRSAFVTGLLQDDKVKVTIKAFRDKRDFVDKMRKIIQRENSFQSDIDFLESLCFNGNVENKIIEVQGIFEKIKKQEDVEGVTGFFVNLVKDMTWAQMDELELLLPEDEIDIKYKPSGSPAFKPLSTASAGQKTTAVLTFILSQGNIPLLLDQPEDDLDNRLVYELIVDRLRQAKCHRQIIVVTHNANIPVNGDAEYIISMNSESQYLKVLYAGSVEQQEIKKEICDVMEGSEQAFKMRSKRYDYFDN